MKEEIIEVSSIAVEAALRNRVVIKMHVALGHAADYTIYLICYSFINFIPLLYPMKIDKTIAKYRKHLIGFVDEGGNKKSYLNDRILINLLIKLSDLMADGNKIIINTIRAHIMIANSTNENLSMPPNQASSNLGVVQGDMAYMRHVGHVTLYYPQV